MPVGVRRRRHVAVRARSASPPRYPPPRAQHRPRPRRSRGCGASMPIVLAHKWIFGVVAGHLVPRARLPGADPERGRRRRSTTRSRTTARRSTHFVIILVVLGAAALRAATTSSRNYLLSHRVPHRVRPAEHHLRAPQPHVVLVLRPRAVGPAHLACQLRHPLGADVPVAGAVHPRAVQRRCSSRSRRCCSINVPLAFVAMSTMPFVVIVGVRMRKQMFPVSWLIQCAPRRRRHHRRREHPGRARREVVRGGERPAPARSPDAARAGRVGERRSRPTSAPTGRRSSRTCPGSGRRSCCSTAATSPSTARRRSATSSRSTPTCSCCMPPFRQLGMIMMMGQRASASAQRIYEVLDEQPDVVDHPGAVDLVECRGDVHFDDVDVRLRQRHAGARRLRPAPAPGRDGRARRPHRQRQVHRRRGCSAASTT